MSRGPAPVSRRLRGPADTACLDAVHALLADLWDAAPDVAVTDRMLFETALVEIVGNVVEHGGLPAGRPAELELEVAVHPARVEALLRDTGPAVPDAVVAAVSGPGTGLPDDPLAESGRGLALARAVADLHHERVDGGNRWWLSRTRDRSDRDPRPRRGGAPAG